MISMTLSYIAYWYQDKDAWDQTFFNVCLNSSSGPGPAPEPGIGTGFRILKSEDKILSCPYLLYTNSCSLNYILVNFRSHPILLYLYSHNSFLLFSQACSSTDRLIYSPCECKQSLNRKNKLDWIFIITYNWILKGGRGGGISNTIWSVFGVQLVLSLIL